MVIASRVCLRRAGVCMAAAVSLLVAACSSVPPVTPVLSAGTASIEAARAAGAPQLAPVEFDMARGKFERARQLALQRQDREAVRLAEQADVDAQLARAKADAERARRVEAEANVSLQALREELRRRPLVAPVVAPMTAPVVPPAPAP